MKYKLTKDDIVTLKDALDEVVADVVCRKRATPENLARYHKYRTLCEKHKKLFYSVENLLIKYIAEPMNKEFEVDFSEKEVELIHDAFDHVISKLRIKCYVALRFEEEDHIKCFECKKEMVRVDYKLWCEMFGDWNE